MRTRRDTKKKLYRRESVTSKGPIASGGEYRWGRHGKQADDEQLPLRESMHGRIQHGMDYTPLFAALLHEDFEEIGRSGLRYDKRQTVAALEMETDYPCC